MSYRSEPEATQSDSKQKVTLYLPAELHRKLKIRSAVEVEPMSVMAERALSFYLDHPEVVDHTVGTAHQVYHCPNCAHPFVIREGEAQSLSAESSTRAVIEDPETELVQAGWSSPSGASSASTDDPKTEDQKQDELVVC